MPRNPQTFRLGTVVDTNRAMRLPGELATRRTAIFGMSGSGKSNTATVCIEALIRSGEQVVLVDPKGEGWGLRVGSDGKAAGGLDVVIFGGPHADLPLHVEHADRIADFVVETGSSVVLSTLAFDTEQDERRFVTAFLKRLYKLKSQATKPVRTLVALEEAHLFVPQMSGGGKGEYAQLVAAVKRIARQGRSFGIGTLLIDQRTADVANSVITQCELLIVHQLAHKSDRDALNAWVKAYDRDGHAAEFFDQLAALKPGEAWVWSPAWLSTFARVDVDRRATLDTGDTPSNSKAARNAKLAPVNLDELKDQLAEVVHAAEDADPRKLKQQVKTLTAERAKLERRVGDLTAKIEQLARQPKADPKAIEKAVDQALTLRDTIWRQELSKNMQAVAPAITSLKKAMAGLVPAHLNGQADIITAVIPKAAAVQPSPTRLYHAKKPLNPTPAPDVTYNPPDVQADDLRLGKRHRQILDTLAWWESIGNARPGWAKVAALIGSHPNTKTLTNARGELKRHGLIAEGCELTDAGRAAATLPDTPPTLDALHDVWRERMSGRERDLFDYIINQGGEATWPAIADHFGFHPNTKTWTNARGRLNNTYGLTESRGGKLAGTALMYPEGLE